jgi:hypothetical protein
MRKLAREVTIFALLGFLLTTVGLFTKLEIDEVHYAKAQAAKAVHAPLPGDTTASPLHTVDIPLKNGTVLHVRECSDSEVKLKHDVFSEQQNDCRYFADWASQFGGVTVSAPLGSPAQIALEKEYWAAYKKSNTQNLSAILIIPALDGVLWGVPIAIGLWFLYRLVRFAISG